MTLPLKLPTGSPIGLTCTVICAGVTLLDAVAANHVESDKAVNPTDPPAEVTFTTWSLGGCPANGAEKFNEVAEVWSKGLLLTTSVTGIGVSAAPPTGVMIKDVL